MLCMIISQRPTFHARLAVKGPNIYLSRSLALSLHPQHLPRASSLSFFRPKEPICAHWHNSSELTAECKTLLISISLSPLACRRAAGGARTAPPEAQVGKRRLLTPVRLGRSSPARLQQEAGSEVGGGGGGSRVEANGRELLAAALRMELLL